MGNNTDNDPDDEIIPLSAPITQKPAINNNNILPVVIAAFVGALAGAVVGTQIG